MKKFAISFISLIALVSIGTIYGMIGITTIEPGEVGLEIQMIGTDRGVKEETLNTGTRWVEPVTNDVVVYDTRDRQYSLYAQGEKGISASTKDGQKINVDVSLQLGLSDALVPILHETVGPRYFAQVVYPAARSIIRAHTAKQLSDEIYTGKGRTIVQNGVETELQAKLKPLGIRVVVNLRDIRFTDSDFIALLTDKAKEAQRITIESRKAEAAINTAKKVENQAEGQKQKRIKAAEADKEERRLEGEGERLKQQQIAKGILAIAKAKAEGTRLQVLAYGSGQTYASVKWAENLGPNVKVYGIPTGAPGTASMMDLNGILKGAFGGMKPGGK